MPVRRHLNMVQGLEKTEALVRHSPIDLGIGNIGEGAQAAAGCHAQVA